MLFIFSNESSELNYFLKKYNIFPTSNTIYCRSIFKPITHFFEICFLVILLLVHIHNNVNAVKKHTNV